MHIVAVILHLSCILFPHVSNVFEIYSSCKDGFADMEYSFSSKMSQLQ